MWWLIAWLVLSLLTFLAFAFMLAGVPSSERASGSDFLKLALISFGCWAIALLVMFGLVAAVEGIF